MKELLYIYGGQVESVGPSMMMLGINHPNRKELFVRDVIVIATSETIVPF